MCVASRDTKFGTGAQSCVLEVAPLRWPSSPPLSCPLQLFVLQTEVASYFIFCLAVSFTSLRLICGFYAKSRLTYCPRVPSRVPDSSFIPPPPLPPASLLTHFIFKTSFLYTSSSWIRATPAHLVLLPLAILPLLLYRRVTHYC